MASLLTSSHRSLLSANPNPTSFFPQRTFKTHFVSFTTTNPRFATSRIYSSGDSIKPISIESSSDDEDSSSSDEGLIVDEWGEKAKPETELPTKFADADPPKDEDEWGGAAVAENDPVISNGGVAVDTEVDDKLKDLKRCLLDTVYGIDLGLRASAEIRAEATELVGQLEAANPTPAPTESPELLDGNWVLVYTSFSELLPLLALGVIPTVKVDKISQTIDTSSRTIDNTITISSPLASFSFSATASFEVRSPSRIQVEFKEGTLKPPEIKSNVNLPENVDIFGQKINLSPLQQSLAPLQDAVAGIARTISGQPPLKLPIPGDRSTSWLITTYLDKDLRISRGDGGLFVLARQGSPLLYQ